MRIPKTFGFFVLILLLAVGKNTASGGAGTVVINEIAWMGTPVEGVDQRNWWRYEWMELYNPTDTPVRVDGWKVGLYREKLDFEIPLYGTIAPQGYFLIGSSSKIPNFDLNYSNLAGKFVNEGQRVVLKNSSGTIVEEIDARQGWFAGDNDEKLTMARKDISLPANDPTNWGNSLNSGGTPKAPNILSKEISKENSRKEGKEPLDFGEAVRKEKIKQDLVRSLSAGPTLFHRTFFIALLVALGSLVGILLFKRYLESLKRE